MHVRWVETDVTGVIDETDVTAMGVTAPELGRDWCGVGPFPRSALIQPRSDSYRDRGLGTGDIRIYEAR